MKSDDYSDLQKFIADTCRWVPLELSNETHTRLIRLHRSRSYLEDTIEQIDGVLEQMGDEGEL